MSELQCCTLFHHLNARLQRRFQQASCKLWRQEYIQSLDLFRRKALQLGVMAGEGGDGAWRRVGTGLMRIERIGNKDECLGFFMGEVRAAYQMR